MILMFYRYETDNMMIDYDCGVGWNFEEIG